jgi:hypothetical protein
MTKFFTRFFQVGVLSLLLLLLTYQEGVAAASKKAISKDNEFNDPLLEEEAEDELQEKQIEEEAFRARGNTPLEENKPPEPPPEAASEFPIELQKSDEKMGDHLEHLPSPKTESEQTKNKQIDQAQKVESSPQKVTEDGTSSVKTSQGKAASDNMIVDKEHEAIVNFGDESRPPTGDLTAALPRWDPQDPHKGFIKADEEEGYLYREDSSGSEKEYENNLKIVPKAGNYQKGLLYVSADGYYVYGGEDSEKEGSASIRVAQMEALPLKNPNVNVSFEDIYGSQPISIVLIDYDWLNFRKFGQWVLSIGTGFGQVEGPGRFVSDGAEANERYTFYILLNHISFTYRFQYSDHPWFVPYFSGGGVPALLAERRDDNKRNKSKFVTAAQASGGVRINIGKLDTYGSASMDAEYGINNMWLDVEVRRIQSFDSKIDISSNLINAGLGFDF